MRVFASAGDELVGGRERDVAAVAADRRVLRPERDGCPGRVRSGRRARPARARPCRGRAGRCRPRRNCARRILVVVPGRGCGRASGTRRSARPRRCRPRRCWRRPAPGAPARPRRARAPGQELARRRAPAAARAPRASSDDPQRAASSHPHLQLRLARRCRRGRAPTTVSRYTPGLLVAVRDPRAARALAVAPQDPRARRAGDAAAACRPRCAPARGACRAPTRARAAACGRAAARPAVLVAALPVAVGRGDDDRQAPVLQLASSARGRAALEVARDACGCRPSPCTSAR